MKTVFLVLLNAVLVGLASASTIDVSISSMSEANSSSSNTGLGFGAAAVAIAFFGSNFVPVKSFETGDGVFFQWIMCSAIFISACVVNAVQEFPKFEPLAMFGGFLWCTGNMTAVSIIKMIGLGLGMLIWGGTNLIMGWASSRFGLFGLKSAAISAPALNSIGVAICLLSLVIYFFVKAEAKVSTANEMIKYLENSRQREERHASNNIHSINSELSPLINSGSKNYKGENSSAHRIPENFGYLPSYLLESDQRAFVSTLEGHHKEQEEYSQGKKNILMRNQQYLVPTHRTNSANEFNSQMSGKLDASEGVSWVDYLSPLQKRVFGCTLAAIAGMLYGVSFDPVQYIIDNRDPWDVTTSSKNLDYVFSHFTGIYITSTAYFLLYCIAKKNKPVVFPSVILPAFISGLMWAIADISWFIANDNLSQAISFPIITTGPGLVASCWGIFVYKEIREKRNLFILIVAFSISIVGVILTALSKS